MKKLFFLLPLIVLTSCTNSSVYSEMNKDFENNRWLKEDIKIFEFEVEEPSDSAKIAAKFSHIYEPGYNNVPLEVTIKNPAGDEETFTANLLLKDAEGNEVTDCLGDMCDLEQTIKDGYSLKKGKYIITLANNVQTPYLPNVIGIGINIKDEE